MGRAGPYPFLQPDGYPSEPGLDGALCRRRRQRLLGAYGSADRPVRGQILVPVKAALEEPAAGRVERLGHGRLEITDDKVRAAERRRFIDIVTKARAMSDTEFEVEKAKLAAQLNPQVRLDQILEGARVVRDKGTPRQVSRAARWLLNPRIIPILEERLGLQKGE